MRNHICGKENNEQANIRPSETIVKTLKTKVKIFAPSESLIEELTKNSDSWSTATVK